MATVLFTEALTNLVPNAGQVVVIAIAAAALATAAILSVKALVR